MEKKYPNDELLRFLVIGNSHTIDASHLLWEVFHKEMPEQKVCIGSMYHSGCSISQHLQYAAENAPEYWYCKNTDGNWNVQKVVPLTTPFEDEQWDVVMLHEMNGVAVIEDVYKKGNYIQGLMDYVNAKNGKEPTYFWNFSWANPTQPELFEPPYSTPHGWLIWYTLRSDFNYEVMANQLVDRTQKYVVGKYPFAGIAPTGTAFYYIRNILKQDEKLIYRDYTHATDFGRLVIAYIWYATLTGQTEIKQVKVDRIPAALRGKPANRDADLPVTEEMKNILLEAVNYALKNPMTIPDNK
ncbi:MAG: DUF4886 domain-containing protein [Oscillospiraceae bacterium]|nr:DUF4886 domain-containing protein [Oscillospiraceae bacterium]